MGKTFIGSTIVDNPGFWVIRDMTNDRLKPESYYDASGVFNEDYTSIWGKYWLHEGIDIGTGGQIKPVVSFINGKVVVKGEGHVNYGNYYIIQNTSNNKEFYLTAHLDKHVVDQDADVCPGDVIGLCGNTGNAGSGMAIHLHLGLYVADDIKDFYVPDKQIIYWKKQLLFNPFLHNDQWGM